MGLADVEWLADVGGWLTGQADEDGLDETYRHNGPTKRIDRAG